MSLPPEPRVDAVPTDAVPADAVHADAAQGDAQRAADALDRLVRGADTRRERSWSLPSSMSPSMRWSGGMPRAPLAVALAVGLAVVVVLVVLQRRPAPIDDQLPVADASATTVASAGAPSEGTAGGPSTSAPTAGDGTSTTVAARIVVHVAGAVVAPGVVEVAGTGRVVDAVHAAGGLLADADPDRVNLAAPLSDGQRVVIPVIGQQVPAELAPTGPPASGSGNAGPGSGGTGSGGTSGGAGGGAPDGPIDLNSADAALLDELPGVGPSTAAAIISHREQEGPFTSVDGLLDVRGIGEAKLEALRDLVTVGG